ncbi:hypothetical protein HU200_024554 [Digitaria exilis]|uniref:Uncharacterized protein n=1 Tax=Digitaria exilis TaxID=1010633 RepID=A0A835C029_9POAL|nr:hypothetical protein HU200_024554 [Digitaria exilis]
MLSRSCHCLPQPCSLCVGLYIYCKTHLFCAILSGHWVGSESRPWQPYLLTTSCQGL